MANLKKHTAGANMTVSSNILIQAKNMISKCAGFTILN